MVTKKLLLLMAGFAMFTSAYAVNPPNVAAVVATDHTVTYEYVTGSFLTTLEQKIGPSGAWTGFLGTTANGNQVEVQFTGVQPGTVSYRVAAVYLNFSGVEVTSTTVYSTAVDTTVFNGPVPTQDLVSDQLLYTYETSMGAYDSDGIANDIFVNRTAGGTSGNGTIEDIVLRNLGNGEFETIVVEAGSALANQVAGWLNIDIELNLIDFNLDGFVDVVLDNISDFIPGIPRQIIVSSGQILNYAPANAIAYQGNVESFMQEFGEYIENPNYYEDTAPIIQITELEYRYFCYDDQGDPYLPLPGDPNTNCLLGFIYVTYNVYDLSGFNQDALDVRFILPPEPNSTIDPVLTPGSSTSVSIETVLERVFDVEFFGGTLGDGCNSGVFAYDDDYDLPCNDGDFFGDSLFRVLIGEVVGVESTGTSTPLKGFRYLTASEKALLTVQGIDIRGVEKVRIYRKGYGGYGAGLFGSSKEVMAPNGNIYIGPNQDSLTWSEDYSAESIADQALFLHETVHTYQTRNQGCGSICLGAKKVGADYTYYPLVAGKPFFDYGIEQEAEMIRDRWRKCNGLASALFDNLNSTLAELITITTPNPFPLVANICVNQN